MAKQPFQLYFLSRNIRDLIQKEKKKPILMHLSLINGYFLILKVSFCRENCHFPSQRVSENESLDCLEQSYAPPPPRPFFFARE